MDDRNIIVDETGAQRLLGYILDVGHQDKCARCRLTLTEQHLNRHNVMHGGIGSALLDNAMGATASLSVDPSGRAPFMTITLNTQFLAAAASGSELTATGKVTGGGRSLLFLSGDLVDSTGRVIATATGVFKRVPPERLTHPD